MADNSRPVAEPLQKGAQAAQAVRGAVKTGKAIAGAAKGAAAGGVWGAVAGFAWENRKFVGKVIIAATAVLMIPILILCMLPGIIFGGFGNSHSPADPDTPIMNSSAAIDGNLTEISTAVSRVLSEALTDTLSAIDNDYAACTADGKEVINPYERSPNFNANQFVGQYCAAKNEDYAAVSVSDMESMLRSGKDKLYSYTKKEEERTIDTVTTSVTVDASTGEETTTETVTTTTEKWIVYTVSYNGEANFADEVFHLTAEQKDLADDYAYNLSLFLGDSMFQGLPTGYTTVSSLGNIRYKDGQTAVVYFNQLDERYAGQPYGTDNIGGYGCGPTAMSIVVSSLTNDTVDPIEMARWSYENGYWCSGSGSYHALIPAAAKAWGLNVEGCTASDGQKIADALTDGKLVVAIMLKGHFTSSGHFIVLRGVKDGKILVADPASYDRSSMEWDLSIILNEASTHAGAGGPFWIIGYEIFASVLPVIGEIPDVQFVSCHITDNRMYIKAVDPHLTAEVAPGDTVKAGVVISNSEVGLGSVSVQPLIYRELDGNGIAVAGATTKRIHRGRVNSAEEHFMLASQEVLTEADRTFLTELQETVRSATDEEQFSQIDTLMQSAKHQAMNTADIPAVVHTAGRDFGITDTEQNGVLQRLIESDDLSLYGLANAVTRHSQDVESYDRATDLEGIGFNILSMPPRQWTRINQIAA